MTLVTPEVDVESYDGHEKRQADQDDRRGKVDTWKTI